MSFLVVKRAKSFKIDLSDIASDKSISHRCAIFSLLSDGASVIRNYLMAEDTLATLEIVKKLGAKVEFFDDFIKITPPIKINEPPAILDCGNSGTAIRLFMGFLASKEGFFVLFGDEYLCRRPMKRISKPLKSIGALIDGREDANFAPISIRGVKNLEGFEYESKIASAQVKSAMILAALNASKASSYTEPHLSRDHSERMLKAMGASILSENNSIKIEPLKKPLDPLDIRIPSDPSSAFFFAVAAAIVENSTIRIKNLSLNPTRIEAYKVLRKMGANIEFIEKENKYEPIGDIVVKNAPLSCVEVNENIAWLIDELPALSIAMAYAKGKSVVKNAKELRVKESDRIKSVVKNLKACGIKADEFEDGYFIEGSKMSEAVVDSFGDHRVAMSFAVAGLKCGIKIEDVECIKTSFPNFIDILSKIAEVNIGD